MKDRFQVHDRDPLRCLVHPDGQTEELPLSSLRTPHDHIHGELVIVVNGQMLPHLGYFGPREIASGRGSRNSLKRAERYRPP
jgi:hypothetical protein